MTAPMAPQPDPDLNDLGEGALAEANLADGASAGEDSQVDELNLTPDTPGPAGTGEAE
ncbi:MAG TPA: hypothetical protein VNA12_00725 [Mycobacteriales bacterium]|nr:hypothetical protein [Mycobacteriales bacterium]